MKWITSAAAAQTQGFPIPSFDVAGKTVLTHIRSDLPGKGFRLVFGERYGSSPVRCTHAVAELNKVQTDILVDGKREFIIPAGASIRSDPVRQEIYAGDELRIWVCFSGKNGPVSSCAFPQVHSKAGDFCGACFEPEPVVQPPPGVNLEEHLCGFWALETALDDDTACQGIAALGDSVTAIGIWVNPLRTKLAQNRSNTALWNMGIGGNRLLRDTNVVAMPEGMIFGRAGLSRLYRDALDIPGISLLMLALGINDISQPGATPGFSPPSTERCTTEELTGGYRQVIASCHERGIKVIGCTITPFGGYATYNEESAAIWREANDWIRTGGEFDGVADFTQAVEDPRNKGHLLPAYDSGDHLHPNTQGGQAMADCVDVDKLAVIETAKLY
jgi:lysophospholipase L1-like esterase